VDTFLIFNNRAPRYIDEIDDGHRTLVAGVDFFNKNLVITLICMFIMVILMQLLQYRISAATPRNCE
jgi:hypothetical protein